jgi:siroheme synthase-like protein
VSILPIGLRADQLTVLVVGAGRVGTRKTLAFLSAGARVRVVDPNASEELRAHTDERLELIVRDFMESDTEDADIVVAATADAGVNAQVVHSARARRRLVNRADDPSRGTFDTLAVHRSGALAVGVSAVVPQAAARIRDEIGRRFGASYGQALELLARVRSARLAAGEWPQAAESLVGEDFCATVERGTFEQRAAEWA